MAQTDKRARVVRVVVHDYAGHPFQVQLSRSLAVRGYEVLHLYCGKLVTPRGALVRKSGDSSRFEVRPIEPRRTIDNTTLVRRRVREFQYGRQLMAAVARFQPNVVLSANSPLDVQAMLTRWGRRTGVRFVFWLQDLIGVGACRVLGKRFGVVGRAMGAYFQRFEGRVLRRSDRVVLITEDFRPMMDRWKVDPRRVSVIENWAPLDEVPVRPRDNAWAARHGLLGKRVLLYSGTLGMKHNPELLVRLAAHVHRWDDVRVVVISEGTAAAWLSERKRELALANLLLLPFQPFDEVPEVLGAADVLLAVLERDAGVFCVPSKVLTNMCASRPLLLSVPQENLAARIVQHSGAGITVAPEDVDGFLSAAVRLLQDPEEREVMARNGRRYAEERFDIERITQEFEKVIVGDVALRSSAGDGPARRRIPG